jgi:hypothetical protein
MQHRLTRTAGKGGFKGHVWRAAGPSFGLGSEIASSDSDAPGRGGLTVNRRKKQAHLVGRPVGDFPGRRGGCQPKTRSSRLLLSRPACLSGAGQLYTLGRMGSGAACHASAGWRAGSRTHNVLRRHLPSSWRALTAKFSRRCPSLSFWQAARAQAARAPSRRLRRPPPSRAARPQQGPSTPAGCCPAGPGCTPRALPRPSGRQGWSSCRWQHLQARRAQGLGVCQGWGPGGAACAPRPKPPTPPLQRCPPRPRNTARRRHAALTLSPVAIYVRLPPRVVAAPPSLPTRPGRLKPRLPLLQRAAPRGSFQSACLRGAGSGCRQLLTAGSRRAGQPPARLLRRVRRLPRRRLAAPAAPAGRRLRGLRGGRLRLLLACQAVLIARALLLLPGVPDLPRQRHARLCQGQLGGSQREGVHPLPAVHIERHRVEACGCTG